MELSGGAGKTCLKCGHVRTAADAGPDYACPKCGAVYAKVEAAQKAREQAQLARQERAEQQAWEDVHLAELRAQRNRDKGLSVVAHVVYALYALPLGSLLAGVVIAHFMDSQAKGSYVHSHFRWQINTFWGALLLGVVLYGFAYALVFGASVMGLMAGGRKGGLFAVATSGGLIMVLFLALLAWTLYRVAKGWYALVQGEAVGSYEGRP